MLWLLISLCFFYSTHAAQEWQPEQNRTPDNSRPTSPMPLASSRASTPDTEYFTPIGIDEDNNKQRFFTPEPTDEEVRIAAGAPGAPRKPASTQENNWAGDPRVLNFLNKGDSNIK